MGYTLAMEDELLRHWQAFKHAQPHDTRIVEQLLHLYKPPHISCVRQLEHLGIQDPALKSQLANQGLVNQSLEELASKTDYKIVLALKNDCHPYVCIQGDALRAEYILTSLPGSSRNKSQALLSALMQNAGTILIQDRYLQQNWQRTQMFFDLLPKKPLSLIFGESLDQRIKTALKQRCADWKIKHDSRRTYSSHHDRYLRIDEAIEVVVTSGLDYLFDTSKECTLIIRKI